MGQIWSNCNYSCNSAQNVTRENEHTAYSCSSCSRHWQMLVALLMELVWIERLAKMEAHLFCETGDSNAWEMLQCELPFTLSLSLCLMSVIQELAGIQRDLQEYIILTYFPRLNISISILTWPTWKKTFWHSVGQCKNGHWPLSIF